MRVLFCLSMLLLFHCMTLAQRQVSERSIAELTRELNSQTFETLNRRLHTSMGKERIDYLNMISYKYRFVQADSCRAYALQAYKEASVILYARGIIGSFYNQAELELHLNHLQTAKSLAIQATEMAKQSRNDEMIIICTIQLGWILEELKEHLNTLSIFEPAEESCKKTKDERSLAVIYTIKSKAYGGMNRLYDAIRYINKAVAIYKKIGLKEDYAREMGAIAALYYRIGDHQSALQYYLKQSAAFPDCGCYESLHNIGNIYLLQKKYDSALYYYDRAIHSINSWIRDSATKQKQLMKELVSKGEVFVNLGDHDKALGILLPVLSYYRQENNIQRIMIALPKIGKAYSGKKEFTKALDYGRELVQLATLANSEPGLKSGYDLLATSFGKLQFTDSAFHYLKLSSGLKEADANTNLSNAVTFYKAILENEAAEEKIGVLNRDNQIKQQKLELLNKENRLKQQNLELLDQENQLNQQELELLSKENLLKQQEIRLNAYKAKNENEKANASIALLNRDNRLKQQKLNFMIISLAGFFVLAFLAVRYISLKRRNEADRNILLEHEMQIQKLENENKQASLQHQVTELEMQALRAQMNPHFIFNCLNAINHFILSNDTEAASDYLTKFSRLIRMVLQNSSKKNISLADELTTLKLYVKLEQVRFKNHFDFTIVIDEDLDTESVMIPPLLLQPFVENAIWHGLMPKREEGRLAIEISIDQDMLLCTITDNGIGRQNAALNNPSSSKKKSMGVQITANRLHIIDEEKEKRASLDIVDLKDRNGKDAGTKVTVKIPVAAPAMAAV